jgi:hypothetical protein
MTTKSAEIEATPKNGHTTSDPGSQGLAIAGAAIEQARDVVVRVGASVPSFVEASRRFAEASIRAIDLASDERIAAGTTLSLGLAIGMLIGGAPRLLTAVALVPVAAMGLAMLDRRSPRVVRSGSAA